MEVVTGIAWHENVAIARTVSEDGIERTLKLKDLASQGLPTLEKKSNYARRVTTNFSSWQPVSFNTFASGFHLETPEDVGHSTWEFDDGVTHFVIPALAVLRALIRPGAALFPRLFKPQSLDDVCSYCGDDPKRPIRTLGTLGDPRARLRSAVMHPLSWFYCFPSARHAWASVYHGAKLGQLDIALPKASVTFNIRCHRARRTSYVTSLNTIEITAHEEPFEFASAHPRLIPGSAFWKSDVPSSAITQAWSADLSQFASLSDQEWNAIEPLLTKSKGLKVLDSRAMMNAVLAKTTSNASWEAVVQAHGGSRVRAPTAYSRWKADGRWDAVIQRLNDVRTFWAGHAR